MCPVTLIACGDMCQRRWKTAECCFGHRVVSKERSVSVCVNLNL